MSVRMRRVLEDLRGILDRNLLEQGAAGRVATAALAVSLLWGAIYLALS